VKGDETMNAKTLVSPIKELEIMVPFGLTDCWCILLFGK
jgi:hypothetical protein